MKLILAILVMTLLAGEANAQARYMPRENAYSGGGTVNNPQPIRAERTFNYRPERARVTEYRNMPRIPVYREASYREARMTMPRNIPMPRNFRIDMNPAGRTPH